MSQLIVYGIKNCDTVKKSLALLDEAGAKYTFHDYKTKGIDGAKLKEWVKQVGWEALVNRKGMTWRQLDEAVKEKVTSASSAISLMREKTSVIKRPLIEMDGKILAVGFDEENFRKLLK
jgi:arsenate reductase (glutaredoxin)